MTIPISRPPSGHNRPAYASFRPNRQMPGRIPLVRRIIGGRFEAKLREIAAALNLFLQAVAVIAEFCRVEVLASNLELVP